MKTSSPAFIRRRTQSARTTVACWLLIGATLTLLLLAGSFNSSADVSLMRAAAATDEKMIAPAGTLVMDVTTRQPAIGALPVDFVRSPDADGPNGDGRYLVAVNSGHGVQFSAATNRAQQSLSVIDLAATPAPAVVQSVYFPTPQSANIGAVFARRADADGSYAFYVSGGFENKIWKFRFRPADAAPISPASPGPNTEVKAPFIDIGAAAPAKPTPRYNNNHAPFYPSGLALSDDGDTLYVANNLDDSLGVIKRLHSSTPELTFIHLFGQAAAAREDTGARNAPTNSTYPYSVVSLPTAKGSSSGGASKVYVSCWNDASIAVVDFTNDARRVSYIPVGQHPTMMKLDRTGARLYVVNSDDDSVSVIETAKDREVERISVRLAEKSLAGGSPEGLALDDKEQTLYVANAHSNSVAVVRLAEATRRSTVRGFIPTGQYSSALAFVAGALYVGNGKGTGFDNSSVVANETGRASNVPNDRFPAGTGRGGGQGGEYSVPLISGNISCVREPDERELARMTRDVLRLNHLTGEPRAKLFQGRSPIKHIIYIIRENRTYDQIFGDVERAGDGQVADGDARLAIFGAGDAARVQNGAAQNITPNAHALASRFGLLDRFFVNAEASPDGHNWSNAAFSTDYTDKAYRWNYSGRGRTYDFEGFNRLPNYFAIKDVPPLFPRPVAASEITDYVRRFVPYLHGGHDVAEPSTLYLWDAAARAGLSYRNYGEFVATISEAEVAAVNANRAKPYPDTSPTVSAFPTKKSLEGHHSETYRNFDTNTPDSMTVDSYRAAKTSGAMTTTTQPQIDPAITDANADARFRGTSRLGAWLAEFQTYVADINAGRADRLPNFSTLRLPNDHTVGLRANEPTPQFFVAENDYAVGRIVEAVSASPYWKDTAVFIVEDDAQDGPDHVDCHRSPALVVSAYNRPGALVHELHSTVSLIRTMELLLGIAPMNALDANAAPMDIFQDKADLRPFKAVLPDVALDNLMTPPKPSDAATAYWMRRTDSQDLTHADMADPRTLNEIIWFSVRRGDANDRMPPVARLPVYDALREGIHEEDEERELKTASTADAGKHSKRMHGDDDDE